MSDLKTVAIELAAQVWCRPETSNITMNEKLAYAFADVLANCMESNTITIETQAARIKELEAEQERAFGMLAACGVPKERAKTVANGIDVLTTRFRKFEVSNIDKAIAQDAAIAELESSLAAAVAGKEAAERDAGRLQGEREQLNAQLRKLGADAIADAIDCEHEKLPATRIKRLVGQYGSYRAVGEVLDIDHAYLNRIANGEKDNMSDDALRKLGLRRLFYYAEIDAARKEQP